MASISLRNIAKTYPDGVMAVKPFTLDIPDQEFLMIAGPPGCGKSTLLRMIAGLEDISQGELLIDGELVNHVPPEEREVALVVENHALYPHMTVFDNLAFGLKVRNMPAEDIRRRVLNAAEYLNLSHLLGRKPKALSAIQRQRVILGRAVVREPKVYLFDELSFSMDHKLCAQVRAELARLHKQLGATILYATRNPEDAMYMGERMAVFNCDGEMQQVAAPEDLRRHPRNIFVAVYLGGCPTNFLEAKLVECEGNVVLALDPAHTLKLPERFAAQVKAFVGKDVVAGIQPEFCSAPSEEDGAFQVSVKGNERIGGEDFVCCDVAGHPLMVKAPQEQPPETGALLTVAVDWSQMYLFDRNTQMAITAG